MQRVWSPDMELKAALAGADQWIKAVSLDLELGDETLGDLWLKPGSADFYDFVPLACAGDVAAEAAAMKNCLPPMASPADRDPVRGVARSGRAPGRRPARIGAQPVRARPNVACRHKRLVALDLSHLDRRQRAWPEVPLNRAAWLSLWRPYRLAKRRFPRWLPLPPSRRAIDDL